MQHTAGLVVGVVALLLALEILNALFDSVCEALRRDMNKPGVPAWAIPFELLRRLLTFLAAIGGTTSLVTHELAHAAAQLAFGGKPRVVFLKNGGYAQSSPWADVAPLQYLYGFGGATGLGVICTAPILAGATLLLVTFVLVTPLVPGDVVEVGRALGAQGTAAVHGILDGSWAAIVHAKWWAYPILIVVPLLLAPCMTPSSVDYVHGSLHLLAYGLGAIVCGAVAEYAPRALWVVALAAGAAGIMGAATPKLPKWLRRLLAGLGLGTALIALAMVLSGSPATSLRTALGTLLFALGIAAVTYVAFVALFLGLSLIAVRPKTLWYALAAAPRNLLDLVRPFDTCPTCNIHYRNKCERCGRTPDGPPQTSAA
jgi:hypothetical protein